VDISKTAGHKVTKFKYDCQGQNLSQIFFSPLGQRVLPGAKKVQKQMTGMTCRTVSQFDCKILPGTLEICIEPFSSQFANFHQMREQEGPQN